MLSCNWKRAIAPQKPPRTDLARETDSRGGITSETCSAPSLLPSKVETCHGNLRTNRNKSTRRERALTCARSSSGPWGRPRPRPPPRRSSRPRPLLPRPWRKLPAGAGRGGCVWGKEQSTEQSRKAGKPPLLGSCVAPAWVGADGCVGLCAS